jgi:hypothetical protein
MLRKMHAQVMFLNPNDLNRGSAELIERDFDVEYLDDWIDDYGPADASTPGPSASSTIPASSIGCRPL